MKPSENIRAIWQEMKEMKRLIEFGCVDDKTVERLTELSGKYESTEILFGHESTLLKAIIYYLDKKQEVLSEELSKLKIEE